MTITQHQLDHHLVLRLTGRLDDQAKKPFQEAVNQAHAGNHRHLVVNLTEVPFVASSALGLLALTHNRLKQNHGQLTIVCPPGYVLNLLKLANFHTMLSIVGTEQEIGEKVSGMSP